MNPSLTINNSEMQLTDQHLFFTNEMRDLLEQYYPSDKLKRKKVEKKLSLYTTTIEMLLANFKEEKLSEIVLIGSQLEVLFLNDNTSDIFTIVFPHNANPDQNRVSFLSPLGFQLLLAKTNKNYQLDLPAGEIPVMIKNMIYSNCGNTE